MSPFALPVCTRAYLLAQCMNLCQTTRSRDAHTGNYLTQRSSTRSLSPLADTRGNTADKITDDAYVSLHASLYSCKGRGLRRKISATDAFQPFYPNVDGKSRLFTHQKGDFVSDISKSDMDRFHRPTFFFRGELVFASLIG